jgi:hypothetical protein
VVATGATPQHHPLLAQASYVTAFNQTIPGMIKSNLH